MIDPPKIIETREQPTAAIRFTIPRGQIRDAMGGGLRELMTTVAAQGIGPVGPAFAFHFDVTPDIFDFELGVVISGPLRGGPRTTESVARYPSRPDDPSRIL